MQGWHDTQAAFIVREHTHHPHLVRTRIDEWRAKVFLLHHRVRRGEDLICEGRETRVFVVRDAGTGRLKAIPVPEDLRALCS